MAYITVDKVLKNLGLYETKNEAHEVRVKAERQYFGEYANGNA